MSETATSAVQRVLAAAGAWLVALAMLTGIPVALAMTKAIPADPEAMLAAHLNALAGSAWLFALAWSLPFVRYGEAGLFRLAAVVIGANYANWFITGLKAFLHVKGVGLAGDLANDAVHLSLNVFVVLPAIGGSLAWAWGFHRRPPAQ